MNERIELLNTEFLKDKSKLKEIDRWLGVINRANGWHYDLDIIWVLKHIEEVNLPKGSTILDAGAGLGITQFILASRGYNVISLDFSQRPIPEYTKGIFQIENVNRDLGGYEHEYMNWMNYGKKNDEANNEKKGITTLLKKVVKYIIDPGRVIYRINTEMKKVINVNYLLVRMKNHDSFGKITFLRGTFNNVPLEDNKVDLLVSVSAFEHNKYEDMPGSVKEFERVLKKGSSMLITTSAAEKEDWYFKPGKSWNFTCNTLQEWFDIKGYDFSNYKKTLNEIKSSRLLKSRISAFYKYNKDNGLPYAKLEEAKYVPVGILKKKPD